MPHLLIITLISLLYMVPVSAKGVYQQPTDFVSQSFADTPPEPEVLWLTDDLQQQLEKILQHKYQGRRVRYWQNDQRSVWVLEEIGKKKPITAGISIHANRIERIKVLVFRETRGWEVKHAFFTQQFVDAQLTENNNLDRYIDGISGATLSVRALTKLARIALLLHREIQP